MYRCHIHFYLIGNQREIFDEIRKTPPLERFTHSFLESPLPDPALLQQADVIFAALDALEPAALLEALAQNPKEGRACILLAEEGREPCLDLERITDLWRLPLSREELRFRMACWQKRYKAEKDHWQTRQFLDAAINSTPNLIWFKDKDGIHEKVNDSFCKTVNKPKELVQGKSHAFIWNVEHDDPACVESERKVMEQEATLVFEEAIETGEGQRLLTTYKSPLYDVDGSVMGTVGTAIDITQERAYQREIVQKSRTLETIFTTIDCGIMTHSLDGTRIFSVNQAALRILGYESKEEMLEDGFHMVAQSVVEEDKGPLQESIRSLRTVGDSVSVEYRVAHKDGQELHIMGNVKLMQNEKGEPFYQRFLLDCTQQKLQEQRARQETERQKMELVHALSIDYSLACIFDLDTGKGTALRINDCKYHVLDSIFSGELDLAVCIERYIQSCVHPDDREALRQATSPACFEKELADNNQFYFNYRTVCGEELRYFQMKAVRAGNWNGQRAVVLGFRSVDEETRREMEKKSLLEDALLQANRASKAKSTFLSNMSHDIRTPMNAIVGFTSLAINHIDQRDKVEEYLKKIMTSGNHLLSLINDILDMSRIESGKIHLDEELCSLPDILHSLHSIVQTDVRAKQLELDIDTVDVVDEEIYCDKLRLNQVLLNLLSNSIKYTGAGGTVSLRITEKPGAPDGFAYYEFSIKDTGIGMSPEFVAHIFEPFERERNSTISGIQGTGLGMAITKNIVDMMNGYIEVRSQQGVGSEFIVSFPFRLDSGPKEPQNIPQLEGCRALVVDDDFNICDSVSYMLQQFGLRAEWTLSGKEAVLRTRQAVSRKDDYRVYIVDWLMPDMNGVEVARRIRQETDQDVPIIVLTAYDYSDIEDEAREAGVTAFCRKPLFLSELRRCLESIVNADAAPQEEAAEAVRVAHTGRILLAEDNELNQEIAAAILGEAGFETDIASNGRIAVEMLKAAPAGYYRVVLMDVQMPVMNGYEATRAIREMEDKERAAIPILAMTANAFEEDKREAFRCGMNGHIAKPIDIAKLMETLDQVLG